MTKEEFLNDMTEILDQEETVAMDTVLAEIDEWDSLGSLMFQSKMLERGCGKLDVAKIKQAETVQDLYALAQK
ncbi:MAG: hypothetical protein SPL39_06800 [Selenomonadaceae bacterium]|mgnify:FL=1|nr:hypothetical protein [Selenomonadaceae bacterium]